MTCVSRLRDRKSEYLRDAPLDAVHLGVDAAVAVRVGDVADRLHLLQHLADAQMAEVAFRRRDPPDLVHEHERKELDEQPRVHPPRRVDPDPVHVKGVLEVVEAVLDHCPFCGSTRWRPSRP